MNPALTSEELVKVVQDALADIKAQNVLTLDVRQLTGLATSSQEAHASGVVIASATTTRHCKSLADNVVVKSKEAGVRPLGVEGEREAEWVLIDLAGVIVHVMLPATRKYYDLERLWTVPEGKTAEA